MIEILSPASTTRLLARLLGESERNVRAIVIGSLLLALAAALAWAAVWAGVGSLPQGNPGSAQVLHALMGFVAMLFTLLPTSLMALGRWLHAAPTA